LTVRDLADLPGGAAPDVAAPIVAWRSWLVVDTADGPRLHSTARAQVWRPDEPVSAVCRPPTRLLPWPRRDLHAAPQAACTCGVYAAADLTGALATLDAYARLGWKVLHRVFGEVALWGRVIECAAGWRAEFGYPSRIVVPTRRLHDVPVPHVGQLAEGLRDYGVPVYTCDAGPRAQLAAGVSEQSRCRLV
jgi:hypothetical protein